jgi:hypothetical protein
MYPICIPTAIPTKDICRLMSVPCPVRQCELWASQAWRGACYLKGFDKAEVFGFQTSTERAMSVGLTISLCNFASFKKLRLRSSVY